MIWLLILIPNKNQPTDSAHVVKEILVTLTLELLSLGKAHLNSGLFLKARGNSLNQMSPFSKQGTGMTPLPKKE